MIIYQKKNLLLQVQDLQFVFGLGAMSGPFLCSIFMDLIGSNGFFIFLFFFHSVIGVFGIYRMKIRQTVDNPDSQFVAMPQTITPAGIELNPQTEPLKDPNPLKNRSRFKYNSNHWFKKMIFMLVEL